MISNFPVSTVMRYRVMAQKTIQEMGKRPKAPPYVAALKVSAGGSL